MLYDTATTPQHEPPIGGMAPVDPSVNYKSEAQSQKQKFEIDGDLSEFINKRLFDKCKKLYSAEWLAIKRNMVKNRYYCDGKQRGHVNEACQWVDDTLRPGETFHIDNIIQPHIQTGLMEMSRGRTQLSFSHVAPDSRYGKMVARIAEDRYNAHKKRLFNTTKLQNENLSALQNGLSIRYTFFDWNKSYSKIPVMSSAQSRMGMSAEVCDICTSPKTQEICPECGNTSFISMESPQMQMPLVSNYEGMPAGENNWVSVDPLGILFDLHATCVSETPYWIWEQGVMSEVLQSVYPDIPLGKSTDNASEETALRYKAGYETSTPNTDILSLENGNKQSRPVFAQGWFDYPFYCHYRLKKETKLRNGTIIPAGVKLGDVFPVCLYVAREGSTILDMWGEDKNDKWTAAPYVTRQGTLVGSGTSIAIANQDRKNDLVNLEMQSAYQDSFRMKFVDPMFMDPDQLPNDPTEVAVLTGAMVPGGRIRGSAVDTLEASQLTPEVYTIEDKIDASTQNQLGTFSNSGASLPDLAPAAKNTATGFLAAREYMVGRFAPMLEIKADALDKEQAYQFLINDQKHLTPEQWKKVKGDYGEQALQAFLNCNLREELCIEVVQDSYMPQSMSQQKANLMGFADFIIGTGLPLNSEEGAMAAEQFQVPKELIGFGAQYDAAIAQVAAFKEIADEIVSMHGDIPTFDLLDPVALQIGQLIVGTANLPVDSQMDDQDAMIESFKDWWGNDEGRAATNALKAAVKFRVEELRQKSAQRHAEDQELAMTANAPIMNAQAEQAAAETEQADNEAAMNAEKEESGRAAQADEAKANRQAQLTGKILDLADNEAQREHEKEMLAKQPKPK